MSEINLDRIIALYREIEIARVQIKENLKLLREIYNTLGKDLEEVDKEDINIHKFFIEKITKITREILDSLSEDEKLRFRQHLPEVISICLLSDDEKIEALEQNENYLFDYDEKLIAESLNYTDEEKVNLIKKIMDNTTFVTYVICSIKEDNIKIELLKDINISDLQKIQVIRSLRSDDRKIETLDLIPEDSLSIVIASFKKKKKKMELLDRLKDELDIVYVVKSIKDDIKKIECLKYLKQEKSKTEIIMSLKNEEIKVSVLGQIQNEKARLRIIKTIQNDSLLISSLSYLEKESYRARVILRLENDEDKIKLLSNIKDDRNRIIIIESLKSDDQKIELLDTIKDEDFRAEIVQTLEDDDKKIGQLINFPYEEHRVGIIKSLESDDKKINFLESIEDEHFRLEIIRTIKDVDKRIETIGYLKSETNKLAIANSIVNPKQKLKALGKITPNYERVYKLIYGEKAEEVEGKYTSFGLPENMTIGIEIESVGENHNQLPDDLRGWEGKEDYSIGNKGKEFASPIMRDREKDVKEVYIVNEILKSFGMEITQKCGGHVHIGADYITTEEGYKQLAELWGNAEEIYYLISNKEGELPRKGIGKFAEPISDIFEQADLEKIPEDRFIINAKRIVEFRRYNSINFLNVYTARNTIEFRLANGTLDGDTWVENIRLFGRTVEIAQDLGLIVGKLERGEELTEDEKTKYALKEMLKGDVPLDGKMDILMKILFSEEEQEVYYKRYRANKALEEKEHRLNDVKFGKIDFKQVYDEIENQKGRIEGISVGEEREDG